MVISLCSIINASECKPPIKVETELEDIIPHKCLELVELEFIKRRDEQPMIYGPLRIAKFKCAHKKDLNDDVSF